MRILYDQNLLPSLVWRLKDVLPDSEHVRNLKIEESEDLEIREFAASNHYTILSKDSDFQNLAILKGHPPKSIRIKIGNSSVTEIVEFLRVRIPLILRFLDDPETSHLELS
jgi:predicted nuclease of predicted toxin-antitoxin system